MIKKVAPLVAVFVACSHCVGQHTGIQIDRIATSDQAIPGGDGTTFGPISLYNGIASNRVAFTNFRGDNVASDLWLWDDGNFSQIVGPDTEYREPSAQIRPRLNSSGEVVFSAKDQTGAPFIGHYAQGQTHVLARVGDTVAGIPAGTVIGDLWTYSIREDGSIRIPARIEGQGVSTDNDGVALLGHGAGVSLWLREGQPAPGVDNHALCCFWSPQELPVYMDIFDTRAPSLKKSGLWTLDGTDLQLQVLEGNSISGSGAILDVLFAHDSDTDGNIAFSAQATDPLTNSTIEGVWYGSDGHYELLLQSDTQVRYGYTTIAGSYAAVTSLPLGPDTGPGLFFLDFAEPSDVRSVFQFGDHAPGTDRLFSELVDAQVSMTGDLFFTAETLSLQSGFDRGLWAVPAQAEQPELIAIEGGQFDIGGGNYRKIDLLRAAFSSSDDGYASLYLQFTDGTSGVFLVRAVPEPAACPIAAIVLLLAAGRHMRG